MRILKNRNYIGWLPLCCVLLGAGVLGAIRDSRFEGDITWVGSYPAGLQRARKSHTPLLLSFHTPGCGWCEKLEAETFTDPRVVERSRHYICIRIESDVDAEVVKQYGIAAFPTIVLADPDGKPLRKITGYISPASFAPLLK